MKKYLSAICGAVCLILPLPCFVYSQPCNNWLYLAPGLKANIGIGDLDMSGDQLIVEPVFCRTTAYPPEYHGGDLVSKHAHQYDCTCVLRPNLGYRNGVLQSQLAATGSLSQQDLRGQIGYYSEGITNSNFEGYLNAVRIWNVARTQADIQTFMNSSLPNPTTQAGLVAYYSFDNILNKQGDANSNGIIHNGVQTNQTNPYRNAIKTIGTTGTLTGSNTCNGAPGLLTFHSQAGPGPFTLVYSDGVTTFTCANVMDGVPFPLQVQPTAPTNYTLVSIQSTTGSPVTAEPGISATVNPGLCTLCTGSLGDPVLNVTFGSGNGNAPPLETLIPGASTTLSYQPTSGNPASPTPQDGYYTITNNIPNNSNSSWFYGSKDHTGNANGYMLFENPGYTTGEFFRQKLTTLCGGGKYEFAAWIANAADPRVAPNVILPDLTFIAQTEDGTVLATYNSGPVPELSSFVWHQYGFVFALPAGINTAIIRILDNNPGGTAVPGNDFAMDDITFRPCGPLMTASLAAGQPPSVCPGGQVGFSGTLSGGYANPAYLWQVSADSGKTWTDIPGATNTALTVTAPAVSTPIDYHYRMLAAEAGNIQSPGCRVASNEVILTINAGPNTDFSFTQLPCNPLQVQLMGVASAGTTYSWNIAGMDQAPPDPAVPTLLYTFPDYGAHTITLNATSGCPGIATVKNIILCLTPADIVLTGDSGICLGRSVAFKTAGGLSFCWSPVTGLDDPTSANPTASPTVTTKYHFTSLTAGANLVVNGDFSQGNKAFTSAYAYAAPNTTEGQYTVGASSQAWNASTAACGDHTTGTGNMMIINGDPTAGVSVWTSQTMPVTPNTNYAFSAWIESISIPNPANLQFSINGSPLGSPVDASSTTCTWNQFYTTWNSGSQTSATVSLINQNTFREGNDFALDDISFAPTVMQTDSVTIDVESPAVTVTPVTASPCPGIPLQLQAGGSATYSWSPVTGLNDPTIANPVSLLPISRGGSTTIYTVTGTSARGCTASATTTINQLPELLTLGPVDSAICQGDRAQLYASGGIVYSWSPGGLLDNASSSTPVATPPANTKFYLSASDANGCEEQDSLTIGIRPATIYKAPPGQTICDGFSVKLTSGNGPGYIYLWTPATALSDPSSPSPFAGPDATIIYTLQISDSTCAAYDSSFSVQVTVHPSPVLTVRKDNDIDCSVHSAQLHVTGAMSYLWSPAQGVNNPFSADPVASIDNTTTFIVKGTSSNGCYAYDSLTVEVTATGANTFVVPNAFTPNGDGHNDYFGVNHWGDVQLEEMQIFNRWGVRVFSTRNPSDCWDGTFHGQPQRAGAYPYEIRAHTYCGEIIRKGVVMLIR
jgi:gliding motility-associated-like protein